MLEVFLLSMVPIIELRGSIPLGILGLNLDWSTVLVLGILGSFLPAILIVWLLRRVLLLLDGHVVGSRLSSLIRWFVRRRSKPVERWGSLGLILLVAVPLPLTGAWTGSLVASGLGLGLRRSLLCIFLGLVIAGGIVVSLCLLGVQ